MTAKEILLHTLLQVRVRIRHALRDDALNAKYLADSDRADLLQARSVVETISKKIEGIRGVRPDKTNSEREVRQREAGQHPTG